MLRKLYKYDFLCSSRKNVPLYIFYILLTIAVKIIDETIYEIKADGLIEVIVLMLIGVIGFVYGVMTFVLFFGSFFEAVSRFKKNLFSDEGYLMNTLPVKASQHIWSKLLNTFSWAGISLVVLLIGNWIMEGFGSVKNIFRDIYNIAEEITQLYGADGATVVIILGLNIIVGLLCFAMVLMFFSAFENTFLVSKKKYVTVITGVAIVLLIGMGSFVIGNVLIEIINNNQMTETSIANLIFGTSLAVSTVLFVLSFLGTKYIMEKKLNLQ